MSNAQQYEELHATIKQHGRQIERLRTGRPLNLSQFGQRRPVELNFPIFPQRTPAGGEHWRRGYQNHPSDIGQASNSCDQGSVSQLNRGQYCQCWIAALESR
jgi:hypothetical protein